MIAPPDTAMIINPDGTLVVRAPLKLSNQRIEDQIRQKADWIRTQRAKILLQQATLQRRPFGLLIVDATLPDQDGAAVIRQLRKTSRRRGPTALMLPLERQAGVDGLRLRQQFPRLRMVGRG